MKNTHKRLLATLVFVLVMFQIVALSQLDAQAYSDKTVSSSYSYKVKTGDNLIAPHNSIFTNATQKPSTYTKNMTGKFTLNNWNLINEINGKRYDGGGLSGNYVGYHQGGLITNNGRAEIPMSELGVNSTTKQFTMSFWLKWDGKENFIPISFWNFSFYIYKDSAGGWAGINTYNGDIYGIKNPFQIGQYTHVTLVFTDGSIEPVSSGCAIYINGIKQTLSQQMGTTIDSKVKIDPTDKLYIGSASGDANYKQIYGSLKSCMDEIYTWNTALNDSEIRDMFDSFENDYKFLNGLTGRITFDADSVSNEINNKFYPVGNNTYTSTSEGAKHTGVKLNTSNIQIPLSDMGVNATNTYFTISFWLKSDQSKSYKIPVYFGGTSDTNFSLYEYADNSGNFFGFNTANSDVYGTENPFGANQFVHVTAIFKQNDISGCKLYINGQRHHLSYKGEATNKTSNNNAINFKGSMYINSDTAYAYNGTGILDEINVWNRPLNDSEISSLYNSYGTGNWDTFSYTYAGNGAGYTSYIDVAENGIAGFNYLKIKGHKSIGDSGAQIKIDGLKKFTNYTFSGYVKIPQGGTTFGNGLFFIANKYGTNHLQSVSPPTTSSTDWIRISSTFNTGDNDVIHWRINRGDFEEIDVTGLKLEEGTVATPFISYTTSATYSYGIADNLISPHDGRFLNDKKSHVPSPTYPKNNWSSYYKSGVAQTAVLSYDGWNGNNYYKIIPSGGTGFGDSGISLIVDNLTPNTTYTVSARIKIPIAGKQLPKDGMLAVINPYNSNIMASVNPITGVGVTNWVRINQTFNSGNIPKVQIRIGRGDLAELDVTDVTLTGGENTKFVDEGNGYSGYISPTTVTYTPTNNKINHHDPVGLQSNRSVTLTDTYTDRTWHRSQSEFSYPKTMPKSYYDSGSGQTLTTTLSATGVQQIETSTQGYSETEYITQGGWEYDTVDGGYPNYNPIKHNYLGYMSNNSSTYWGGTYSFSSPPRYTTGYYGDKDPTGWQVVSMEWSPYDPYALYYIPWNRALPGEKWKSERGVQNKYRRGVLTTYRKWTTITVPQTVTKYYTAYKYKANYSATVQLPDAVQRYDDYSVVTEYNATLNYSGTIQPTNIKATSISIMDLNNVSVNTLQAGQSYKARVQYTNDGNAPISKTFDIGLYDSNGNKLGGGVQESTMVIGQVCTSDIVFTIPTSGDYTITAKVDDTNKVLEVNETDNTVTSSKVNVYVQNLKTTSLEIVGLSDEISKSSLEIGKQYRAKIKVKNVGTTNIGAFTIGLYGEQEPPEEYVETYPDPKTQLSTNYNVSGLKSGEELGVTLGKGFAYITFTANSTDIKAYYAWADNGEVIPESNELDNIKSLALSTIAFNTKSVSLKIMDIATNTQVTTVLQNKQYRADFTVTNDQNTDMVPCQVGIYEGNIPNGNSVGDPVDIQLRSGQTVSSSIFFTPEITGNTRNFYIKADNDDSFNEINENDNYRTTSLNVVSKNLTAQSITVTDMSGNAVTQLTQGYKYKANVIVKNSGGVNINEAFNIGLKVNGVLQATKIGITSLNAGASTSPVTFTFTSTTTGTYSLTGIADVDNTVWESDETDNEASTSIQSIKVNLKANSIDIVGISDEISKSQLQQGKQYRAKINFTNDGQNTLKNFVIGLSENGKQIGTTTVETILEGTSATVYITFTENNRGNATFEGFVDSTNVIAETNETDNKATIGKTAYRLNIKAISIDIVGTSDDVSKNPLIQNLQYRAKITILNDSDVSSGNFDLALYDGGTKIGTVDITSLNAGASSTQYITFSPLNRSNRTFIAKADDSNAIDETDETDNTVNVVKTVNKVNIRAVVMDVIDSKGNVQGDTLIKGQPYTARVQLINDGDIDIGAFNLGLYDGDKVIASKSITSLPKGATPTTFLIPFTPQEKGLRRFTAFADDKLQITESIEIDNKVYVDLNVSDMILANFRITNMVNPPEQYTYPIYTDNMPVRAKSGYKVNVEVDALYTVPDYVKVDAYINGVFSETLYMKKEVVNGTNSTWGLGYIIPQDTPINSVISFKIIGHSNVVTQDFDYNMWYNWDGQAITIMGSFLEDFRINQVY